ncbi:MAG: ATP-binding protein, partial [Phycisphaerales bacterium]
PSVLRNALRFGGTTRFNDRSGMGRFGMGLPNSAVSQCRRLEVYTWQKKGAVYFCYLDIDEIISSKMLVVPEPVLISLPKEYESFSNTSTGTIVVWKKCDRLDYNAREDTLTRELPKTLGQIYRYYLSRGKEIHVNGRKIKPFDPLYLMPEAEFKGATQHGSSIKFDIKIPGGNGLTSPVIVKFSLLPEEWQKLGKSKSERQKLGINKSTGFSIIRSGREIDYGYFGLRGRHWTDAWWSCEITFHSELDELFGVTHTKQQIKLSEPIRTTIEKDINANIATLADIVVARGKKQHSKDTRMAEQIAKEQEKFLRTSPEIRDKDEKDVEKELQQYAEEKVTDNKSAKELITEIREQPFVLDFEDLPGAPFYRVRTFGQTTVVSLNRAHLFFEKLYSPLCDLEPASKTALELLLFTLAKAETLAGREGKTWYESQRAEWGRIFTVYLMGIESISDLKQE